MTKEEREEAIKRLKEILTEAVEYEDSVCYVTDEDREPLETAIKALEQEPCDNCEVGNPCIYCKHVFEPQERSDKE